VDGNWRDLQDILQSVELKLDEIGCRNQQSFFMQASKRPSVVRHLKSGKSAPSPILAERET
jgi:hypothetical protein